MHGEYPVLQLLKFINKTPSLNRKTKKRHSHALNWQLDNAVIYSFWSTLIPYAAIILTH